jgi:hypothetical protein
VQGFSREGISMTMTLIFRMLLSQDHRRIRGEVFFMGGTFFSRVSGEASKMERLSIS